MQGNNKMILNIATMKTAVEYWLKETKFVKEAHDFEVYDVKYETNTATFAVLLKECPQTKEGINE